MSDSGRERPLVDQEARNRVRASLDESLLVEAAAGTGKTTELVRRFVAIIAQGRATKGMGGLVAVTFTRKAAGELKLRLRQELDAARLATESDGRDAERGHLEDALGHLEEAHIGTIHSFCAELVRERPVEAGVDPAFRGLSEEEAPRVFERAFQTWIQESLEETPEGVRRALSRLASRPPRPGFTPLDQLRRAGWELAEWRDFGARWERPEFDREARIADLLAEVTELAAISRRCPDPRDTLRQALEPAEALVDWTERVEAVAELDHDELEARLVRLVPELRRDRRKGYGAFAEGVSRSQVIERRDRLIEALEEFRDLADADLAACLRHDLGGLLERYNALKRRSGEIDFVDLLLCARDLLRDHRSVREFFGGQFTHLFVDEFQDTDPLQTEILLLLAADDPAQGDWRDARPAAGKLFLVGDPKQSIYRFRRADVVHYQEIKAGLVDHGVGLVQLRQSFRATEPIQNAINNAFSVSMQEDMERGKPEYIPLAPARKAPTCQPCVVALPVSDPYGYWGKIWRRKIDESQPTDVVAFIDWLVHTSGWQVQDPQTREARDVEPSDVCILFRRYMAFSSDVTRTYTRGLETRGIPHVLVGARTFHQREEVETLRSALVAIEWPDDELAVFATLRGALFSVDDETLFLFSQKYRLHPFASGADELGPDEIKRFGSVVEALGVLARLHRRRNWRPIVQTLQQLLEITRAHAALALRPAGNQVLANVQRVCDLARSYELGGGFSFRGFVQRLADEADQPASTQAPVVEEGAEGVRLMTVHAAKGLEFPVVVLADMTAQLARERPDKHVDARRGLCAMRLLDCAPAELVANSERERERDRAEGVRLAYVAATRARDLLVVPTLGDEPLPGWLEPLHRAVYPASAQWRSSSMAAGCPAFGEASVVERPPEFDGRVEDSVRPGLHTLGEEATHEVVWWDPRVLRRDAEENFGIRQVEILSEDDAGEVDRGIERFEAWRARRLERIEAGKVPEHDVLVVTELEEGPAVLDSVVSHERTARTPSRPSGVRFGTLVHTLLRDLDLDADGGEVAAMAAMHAVMIDAPDDERGAAADAVVAALAHPVFERARRAAQLGSCLREAPFLVALSDGRLLEGTVDLAFREEGLWVIVDYKTDADVDASRERYEIQLAWYLFAFGQIHGEPAEGVLLAV
ncbi:MAG: UvrD-helicase domain-containing protein [Acidobacteriota bacterium]|nr:UvrD-helicase domain-containing protein [Acidobacteriota bacterium]